jgi:4-hydroxy-tetrahydrodipicolinate reductase
MVKCIVIGAAGRMGIRIIHAVSQTEGAQLVGAVEIKGHPSVGTDAGICAGSGSIHISIVDHLEGVDSDFDVLIDFTTPESSLSSLEYAAVQKKAAVIGTTGFSQEQTTRLRARAREIPCVWAPNMSVGVNLLFSIVSQLAPILQDEYDIEIIESHHRLKQDAPSGTAMKIAQLLADTLKRDLAQVAVYQRKGFTGKRRREEIGIQVIRAGDIVGDHTVLFAGAGERLEITHRAHSRDTFAQGAVRAALWVVRQKPGLYDMQDVLGLRK